MKTVRFGSVITRAGKPEHHLTWSDPARDPMLLKAEKQLRLLTVHQQRRGAKKDFGVVGLEPSRDAQYFIFPRTLRSFRGARVVAIDYAAVGERLSLSVPAVRKRPAATARTTKVLTFPGARTPSTRPVPPPEPASPVEKSPPPDPTRADIETVLAQTLRHLRGHRSAAARKRITNLLAALRAHSDRPAATRDR